MAHHDPGAPTAPETAAERQVLTILRRAAQAQRLARCFAYPGPGLRQEVLAAGARDPDIVPAEAEGADALAEVRRAWAGMEEDAVRAEYSRLFLGAGGCARNETGYMQMRLAVAAELADIRGFYRAFGFEPSDAAPEIPDHLSTELEFYSALLLKLAHAALQDWHERREITEQAARRFLEAHLGRWTEAFAAQLRARGAAPPYQTAADAAKWLVARECRLLAASPVPLDRPASGADEPDRFVCPRTC